MQTTFFLFKRKHIYFLLSERQQHLCTFNKNKKNITNVYIYIYISIKSSTDKSTNHVVIIENKNKIYI